jgi:hypothetical protein
VEESGLAFRIAGTSHGSNLLHHDKLYNDAVSVAKIIEM